MERPQWSAIRAVLADLNSSLDGAARTRQQILEIRGVAWSEDGLIKATVGPRGQLIDLEINPRVYRTPNSSAMTWAMRAQVQASPRNP